MPLSYNFKYIWVNRTTVKTSTPASILSSNSSPMEPSSNTQNPFIFSNNIPLPTSKLISKPSSTSRKSYLININMYFSWREPTLNSKILSVPPSIKFLLSISILITLFKKKFKKEINSIEYLTKGMFGQSCALVSLVSVK